MKKSLKIISGSAIGMLWLFATLVAHAAVITVHPPTKGSDAITVTLDTEGHSVNAIELHLTFDPSTFTVKTIADGGSVVDLWVKAPAYSNDNGTIDLAGIIPGGITTANGNVVTIEITPKADALSGIVKLASGQALLNDGKGTADSFSFVSGAFPLGVVVTPTSTATTDLTAPNPFTPVIARDPNIFGGQYFLAFSTTDIGSGIDHYEVLETTASATTGNIAGWQAAVSPYLLKDQTLSSDIYVRAIDRAGNIRVVEIPAAIAKATAQNGKPSHAKPIALGIIIVIVVAFVLLWLRRKKSYR